MSNTSLAGKPTPFEWDGKTYFLGSRDFALEIAFQAHMEERAARKIEQHRGKLGEAWYREQMAIWQREAATNAYEFDTQVAFAYLWTKEGSAEYAWLKLKKGEVDARKEGERADSVGSKGEFMARWHGELPFRNALWAKIQGMEWPTPAPQPTEGGEGNAGAPAQAPAPAQAQTPAA